MSFCTNWFQWLRPHILATAVSLSGVYRFLKMTSCISFSTSNVCPFWSGIHFGIGRGKSLLGATFFKVPTDVLASSHWQLTATAQKESATVIDSFERLMAIFAKFTYKTLANAGKR